MKSTPSRAGAALVLTLSLLILLTVCILAFMAVVRADRQSASLTAATTRAEILGRSAGNLVLADLVSEIRDGSTNLGTTNAVCFRANAGQNMLPQRVLADTNMATNGIFANLRKQSVPGAFYYGANFAADGPSRASDIGSWEASRNGRVLSAGRWSKPALLFGSGFSSTNQLPRWIYITRQDTNGAALNPTAWSTNLAVAAATNKDFVIGRAAYNIYEIGGLLDANVAGRVAGTDKPDLMASLAGANLANMPGLTNGAILAAWRNAVTGASSNQFLAYATNSGLKAGFLEKPAGDRRFVGRQDLLAYSLKTPGGGIDTNSLPYLTHFSRGLDRPSAQATTNTALLSGYPARPLGANPPPLTIRHPSDTTLSDTNHTQLSSGDPVAFRRFPLRRLGLLGPSATATKDGADAIYRSFGLYRDAGQPWTYDHGADNRILTLGEVAALHREPDFFEMLQAAISAGSLGGSAGPYKSSYATSTEGLDENLYLQILKIGACLIDQCDPDDFPTEIAFKDASGTSISAFGIENLPYLNEVGVLAYRPAELPRTKLRGYFQFEVWNPHQNAPDTDPDLQLRVAVTKGRVNLLPTNENNSAGTGEDRFNGLYNGPVALAYGIANPTSGSPPMPEHVLGSFMSDYPDLVFARGNATASGGINFSGSAPGVLEFRNGPELQEPRLLTAPGDPAAATTGSYPAFAFDGTGGGTTSPFSIVDETTPASLPLLDHASKPLPAEQISSPNGKQLDSSTQVCFAGVMVAEADFPDDRADGRPDQACYGVPAPGCWNVCVFNISSADAVTIELQVKAPQGWTTYQRVQNILKLSTANRRGFFERVGTLPADKSGSISFIRPWIVARPVRSATPQITQYVGYNTIAAIDPRTARFTYILREEYGPQGTGNQVGDSSVTISGNGADWMPATTTVGKFYSLAANISNSASGQQYYKDPDGTARRGDGEEPARVLAADQINPMFSGYSSTEPYNQLAGNMADRPILLNRPFQSVGEMGYAFRDLPWKTLDFWSKDSGDGALLDYFCIEETELDASRRPLRAGVINPNTAQAPVLEAVILDSMRKEISQTALTEAQVNAIVESVRADIAASPLASVAELPRLIDGSSFPSSSDKILRKTEKEAFIRALAPVSNVNVWNVLIDVVAQAGRFPPSAASLRDFVVQGEARYWIFAAIDRSTGEIIDTQYELVTE